MRRFPLRLAAAASLCALTTGIAAAETGVSVYEADPTSAAGYYVGPDGVIEYRPAGGSAAASAASQPAFAVDGAAATIEAPAVPAPLVYESAAPTTMDAPAIYDDAPGMEALDPVYGAGAGAEPIYLDDAETVPFAMESEGGVSMEPHAEAGYMEVDGGVYIESGTGVGSMDVGSGGLSMESTAPMMYAEPESGTLYVEPAPAAHYDYGVEVDHGGAAMSVDSYEVAPAHDLPSGRAMASLGDGAYGPSKIDVGGEGPAAQNADVYVSKSAIVTLPRAAREVMVSNPEVVRAILRTDTQTVLVGLNIGSTNAFFFDDKGNQILNLEINVTYDLGPLRDALARNFPDANVSVETVLGEVVVTGTVDSPSESAQIRNLIRRYLYSARTAAGVAVDEENIALVDRLSTVVEDQVMLKVRVAEMRRSLVRQFGIDLSAAKAAIEGASLIGVSNALSTGRVINSFGVNNAQLGGLLGNISGRIDDYSFGALIKAFERHNVMRVLAEPTLTAVTGETASFLAGGQFPYPTSIDDGEVGYDFRDFGVALEFTPVVIGDGRISLRVATEVSELTGEGALSLASGLSIPGIAVRRANTTVELPSGGTMSIAGMLLQRDAGSHAGLPGLKNLPVLGQLFSSSDYAKNETELVILVTPYIVKPGEEKDFRAPTDGFAPSSDIDFYLLGRLHKIYGEGDAETIAARKAIKAPVGFIIE